MKVSTHGLKGLMIAISLVVGTPALAAGSVKIESEVHASGKAHAAAGDKLLAAGDYNAALAAYGEGYVDTGDAAFLYALAQTHKAMKSTSEAKMMFESYLAAGGSLKHKAEAEAELGVKSGGGLLGNTLGAVTGTVGNVLASVTVSLASSIDASAKAAAEKGDQAYKAGKFDDAAKSYHDAWMQSQAAAALYAEGMARARAGDAARARAALSGYLTAQPTGEHVQEAKKALLLSGGSSQLVKKVAVSSQVSAEVQADARKGDEAYSAGKFIDAVKIYGAAYVKKADAALLYAKGMAQYAQGEVEEGIATLRKYLASAGKLDAKADAEATIKASGKS